MLKEKIRSQINDIRDKTLFNALHFKGHALHRHILSNEELQCALNRKRHPIDIDDIVMVTRFFNEDHAIQLIADTLQNNSNEIEKWLLSDTECDYVAYAFFDDATGEGLAKNTGIDNIIQVHGTCVVIRKDFSSICKSFVIVTAYPTRTPDDVDVIYEAIDEYISRKEA